MCVGVCFWVCGDISFTSFTLTMGYFGVWIPSSLVFLSKFLIYLATLSLLIASSHQKELDFGIWFVLIVLLGSWGLVASSSWGLIYLALELQTLSLLVLLTFQKRTYSSEGALKYLVLGSVFSGLFLLGCSLLYDLSGESSIQGIHRLLMGEVGKLFITISLLFKFYWGVLLGLTGGELI